MDRCMDYFTLNYLLQLSWKSKHLLLDIAGSLQIADADFIG